MGRGKLSARMDEAVLERLERRSAEARLPVSRFAERLIDEGLRMEEFPGLVFRAGPAGRRAGLVGGPDVWEIVADLQRAARRGRDPVRTIVESTRLSDDQVRLAAAYYHAFAEEIEALIRSNEELHERALQGLEAIQKPV